MGVEAGAFSFAEMEEMAGEKRGGDLHDALFAFSKSLELYRGLDDFQMLGELPRPMPLEFLISPTILYGHFRAWLRKQGLTPTQSQKRRRTPNRRHE